ncbi:MAG: DUF2384 domain-containing protein [Fulvivirga sp.]|uniref:type II RES/Xre toxin-antitoxin system antitoxin n=1 Tax=Fulvivirga sp. TaxID=1931237 RepID=UPI0032ED2288
MEPALRYSKANDGITKSDFLNIVHYCGLNITEFSSLLPVSKRTIEKAKNNDLLSPVVSDRVLQIAALYQFGSEVIGSIESLRKWMSSPLIALGGKKPLDFINNDTGISIVRDLLGRIEHGVYS